MDKASHVTALLLLLVDAEPLGDVARVDRNRRRVTGCVAITGVKRRHERRRKREVGPLEALHLPRRDQSRLTLLLVEMNYALKSHYRNQERGDRSKRVLLVAVHQQRRHWNVERQSDEEERHHGLRSTAAATEPPRARSVPKLSTASHAKFATAATKPQRITPNFAPDPARNSRRCKACSGTRKGANWACTPPNGDRVGASHSRFATAPTTKAARGPNATAVKTNGKRRPTCRGWFLRG